MADKEQNNPKRSILLTGEHGMGKSWLLAHIQSLLTDKPSKTNYVSRLARFFLNREDIFVQYRDKLILSLEQSLQTTTDDTSKQGLLAHYVPLRLIQYSENQIDPIEVEIEIAIREHKHIQIVGSAGSGKTTLLKFLAFASAKGLFHNISNLPVVLKFRNANFSKGIEACIQQEINQYIQNTVEVESITELLTQGRILLLIDGLDESQHVESDIDTLREFSSRYPGTPIVVTSRPSTLLSTLYFVSFELAPLTDSQVRQFVDIALGDQPVFAEAFLHAIDESRALKLFVSSPLTLRLTVALYKQQRRLPFQKGEFVENYLQTALASNVDRLPKYARELAEQIALYLVSNNSSWIEENTARQLWSKLTTKNLEEFTEAIKSLKQSGLIEELDARYRFTHLILQEYFCSRSINRLPTEQLASFALKQAGDNSWEQVLSLVCERRPDTSQVAKRLFQSNTEPHRLLAAKLLCESDTADHTNRVEAIKNLCELLSKGSSQNTIRASDLLLKFSEPDKSKFCREWLTKEFRNPVAAGSFIFVLASSGDKDESLYKLLVPSLKSNNTLARYQACRALGIFDTERSTELLVDCLENEKDSQVTEQILSSLTRTPQLPNRVEYTTLLKLLAELNKREREIQNEDLRQKFDLLYQKLSSKEQSSEIE